MLTRRRTMILVTVLVCGVACTAGLDWAVNLLVKRPHVSLTPCPADADAKVLTATNVRGQKIAAWWWQGRPECGAVLLCHGHSVDHGSFADIMPFLRKAGVSLLALDFRAHGRSEGDFTSVGLQEWEDIAAILVEAERQQLLPASMPLAAYGRSMGAATLANGAAHLPRINAFILESGFAELRSIAGRDAVRTVGIPDGWPVDRIFDMATVRTGISYWENKPVEGIRAIASRPALLIHDALDVRVTQGDFERLVAAAGNPRTLTVASATHVKAFRCDPVAFERSFLDLLAVGGIIASSSAVAGQ